MAQRVLHGGRCIHQRDLVGHQPLDVRPVPPDQPHGLGEVGPVRTVEPSSSNSLRVKRVHRERHPLVRDADDDHATGG
jgi:hypothetical protein